MKLRRKNNHRNKYEGNCEYCGTYIQPVNLKSWYMISYKEDY